jgi:uncharacterized iron-regulated membrane protein
MGFRRLNRRLHRWCAFLAALPLLAMLLSGLLLQFKKELPWIQPATIKGEGGPPRIGFDRILTAARQVPEAGIRGWGDIDRIDVRPGKSMLKVRARNRWEIQLDTATGKILQSAYRRSDLIEALHDGTFFHQQAKHWLYFPAALLLLVSLLTGLYLFIPPRRRGKY